ncbi:6-bladed beta-propeller [Niabella pedocola]|uniref:6-bladed beta-propeller n=1 Tax=Niabella pedocola TaxID=1752077 RepID=A0ABS8PYN1_9BACT|nr:6-bladed beta-propeller [Niabella pedocola]MCD2425031.1 6-bladed beta-propeller [Niabella pedocola]
MKKLMFVCWAVWLCTSVGAQAKTLYLDPSKTIGAPASRVFEEVTFIPLETTRKSTFGAIKQLVVTDSLFIVLDGDTNALYFFDRRGKFLHKYRIKRYKIRDIQLDRSKNALLIFSLNKNFNIPSVQVQEYLESDTQKDISRFAKATWFYLDNVTAAKTEDLKNFRYAFTNPVRFDKDKFAASFIKAKRTARDTLDYQLKIIDQSAVLQNYFPYNKKTESVYYYSGASQCSIIPTQNDSVLFVTRPFQYEIYTLTPSAITESYKLMLPMDNAVPASFFNADFSSRGEMDTYKMEHPSYAHKIENVIRFKNLMFFDLNLFKGYNRYLFDNKTNLIYDYNKISSDSSSYFLPVSGVIKSFDEAHIYLSLSAKSMFNAKKSSEYRNPQYDDVLTRFFATRKETDNPVLIQLKPKEDLTTK